MNNIKKKLRSQLSDSNVRNGLLLLVTNLTPNITDLLKAKQYQKSHYSYLYLSLLYMKLFLFEIAEIANSVHILLVLSEVTN